MAAVDATKESALGKRFEVQGYPTVKYFKDGELAFDVGNAREEDAIVDFMKDPKEPPPPPPPEKAWAEEESAVVHLTDETFKPTLRKKKRALVMFYAPCTLILNWYILKPIIFMSLPINKVEFEITGCGHCKAAKPEFTAAAEEVQDDPKIMLAAIDCTVHRAACETYDVRGYPTFKIFHYFNKEDVKSFNGDRTVRISYHFAMDSRFPVILLQIFCS